MARVDQAPPFPALTTCPHCGRMAFALMQERRRNVILMDRPGTPPLDPGHVEMLAIECPWCRKVSQPFEKDEKLFYRVTFFPIHPQMIGVIERPTPEEAQP